MTMGTFRSTYPIMPESNQANSTPHFAWFHPGNYLATLRNGLYPFQGTQFNIQGPPPIPINIEGPPTIPINIEQPAPLPLQSMPLMNEPLNNFNTELEALEPAQPAKKPKISEEPSNDNVLQKETKPRRSKKGSSKAKGSGLPSGKRERKNLNFASYESSTDASGIPAPVCSCTGVPRQCYRWGQGGWQSSCCTTNISEYPLPMSTTRPGARVAGRKMSHGAYDKLLQRLAADGYDLSHPIDLKDRWAKHGTNRFVTIK